eukprot:CAMPEP_0172460166 /NCGR_PEP_ID=MMETSP1065-20121228/35817_1 /TAXON_ID=265537 /ORGANISM="Amphiprora paludosa, Strain CCMP125" /LENGTH=68 /DNA_ID=CAMNT_0013215115 /DNA_START=62 /DNA_END=264 /DNA_ORIENTATION=-
MANRNLEVALAPGSKEAKTPAISRTLPLRALCCTLPRQSPSLLPLGTGDEEVEPGTGLDDMMKDGLFG